MLQMWDCVRSRYATIPTAVVVTSKPRSAMERPVIFASNRFAEKVTPGPCALGRGEWPRGHFKRQPKVGGAADMRGYKSVMRLIVPGL